uniref:Uncharacterized protein n=1 Tax=Parascaris equorum TaxID=6256 RepID=A0A914RRB9_PAREQ
MHSNLSFCNTGAFAQWRRVSFGMKMPLITKICEKGLRHQFHLSLPTSRKSIRLELFNATFFVHYTG